MKRQSKAEEALKAQCRLLQGEMDGYAKIKEEMEQKIAALFSVKTKVESEIARLEKARRDASVKAKP